MAVSPDVLMETKVLLKSFKKCKQLTNGLKGYNRKSMICGFLKNTDACQVRTFAFEVFFISYNLILLLQG